MSIKKLNPFSRIPTPILKLIVSLYPGIAAVLLAFFKDPIINATKLGGYWLQLRSGTDNYEPNWGVSIYWFTLFCWVGCYYTFVSNESDGNKKANENIQSAIFRSPNPKIFGEYRTIYEGIIFQLNLIDKANILDYSINIKRVLESICDLTSAYLNQKDAKAVYGANIMIHFPLKLDKAVIEKIIVKPNEWIHFQDRKIESFDGILYLDTNLSYRVNNPGADQLIDSISLPVIKKDNLAEIAMFNIPGAPRALIEDSFLFKDVKDIEHYRHLGDKECELARKYWSTKLPAIGSIYSFKIPHSWGDPDIVDGIAVLNIDSTKTGILGTQQEYHITYNSLLYPILCQLSPYIVEHYKALRAKLAA